MLHRYILISLLVLQSCSHLSGQQSDENHKLAGYENRKILKSLEHIDFPELGIFKVPSRIDTGARASTLHAVKIEEFSKNKIKYVRFNVFDPSSNKSKLVEAKLIAKTRVRSSNGKISSRPVIETLIRVGNESFKTILTLYNRSKMNYPVLVGRETLNKRFLINPDVKSSLYSNQ